MKTGPAHRFRFPGNWKIQLENTTDGYHFPVVHRSFLSSVDKQTEEMLNFVDGSGYVEDLGQRPQRNGDDPGAGGSRRQPRRANPGAL
ncbi:SRPBCC family protein [Lelliottia nimipressuralis]|uniref:SRPBCC family protein n=1 Tax=Lelliottia nimipressuralis TaxID=69220 RepID=UPI003D2A473D